MRKASDLRRWLMACVPALKSDPDKLQIYLDAGTIATRAGADLSFEYRFTLSVLICDYAGEADEIVVPLLAWIEREQPDLLRRSGSDEAFRFEAEILDASRVDLLFAIEVSEPVLAKRKDDGFEVTHPPTPRLEGVLAPGLDAVFLQGYAWQDLVAETQDPDAVLVDGVPPDIGT